MTIRISVPPLVVTPLVEQFNEHIMDSAQKDYGKRSRDSRKSIHRRSEKCQAGMAGMRF